MPVTQATGSLFEREINEAAMARWHGDFAKALDILVPREVADERETAYVCNNMAQVFTDLGAFKAAYYSFTQALEYAKKVGEPDAIRDVLMGLTYSALRLKKWDEAFKENRWFDARFARSWVPPQGTIPWDGKAADGGLVVICEGGFGDAFLFRRYLPLLRGRVRDRVPFFDICLWPTLVEWFRTYDSGWWRLAHNVEEAMEEEDFGAKYGVKYAISWMDLIAYFGVEGPGIDHKVTAHFINGDHYGLCETAEENGVQRKHRSLDKWTAGVVRDILGVAGRVDWLGPNRACNLATWKDTTEHIAMLRAVITVDTAVAHLACSLRKPTLILLPRRSDWKWFTAESDGNKSPWWPTATLYREQRADGWDKDKVSGAVRAFLGAL